MSTPARGTPWLVGSVALAAVVAVIGHAIGRPSPDVAWNLYVARELLGGSRLGVDLFENTPPMIFALKVPTVAVARFLHFRESAAWSLLVAGLVAMAVYFATRLFIEQRPVESRGLPGAAPAMAAALLLLPGPDFGQRDHVTAILVLPYVCLAARRLGGEGVSVRMAVLTGVLAAIGVGIKPHFVLLPAAVALLLAFRSRVRAVLAPENLAIAGVGAAYVLVVAVFSPDYFRYAAVYGPLYQYFQTDFFVPGQFLSGLPPWATAATGHSALPAYVGLGAFAAVRRYLGDRERQRADSLAVATAAMLLVGVSQGKGWRYHFLPSEIFAVITVLVLFGWCRGRALRPLARVYLAAGAGMVAAVFASVAPATLLRVMHPRDQRLDPDPNLAGLLPLVRAVGAQGYVAVLSTNISSSFPLVLDGGARWALRHPNLWPLVAFYPDEVRQPAMVPARPFGARDSLERAFGGEIVEDLIRTTPDLLLVLRPDPAARGGGGARRFDYLGYFSEVPGFSDRVVPAYQRDTTVGHYDVYWRRGGPSAARAMAVSPRASPPRAPIAGREWLVPAALLAGFAAGWGWTRVRRRANGI